MMKMEEGVGRRALDVGRGEGSDEEVEGTTVVDL